MPKCIYHTFGPTISLPRFQLDKAVGGVLFIDEAYELGKSPYGEEACTALVAAMTDPQYAGLVIIMAGYQAQMSKMLDTNPGLKSRMRHTLEFPDWSPEDCVSYFIKKARALQFDIDEAASKPIMQAGFKKLVPLDGWGNARDVELVWTSVKEIRADRLSSGKAADGDSRKTIRESDIQHAIDKLVASRMGCVGTELDFDSSLDPFAPLDKLYRMEEVKKKLQELRNTLIVAEREGQETPSIGHFVFVGSPGTGKTTVARATATILFQLRLIGRNNVIETSGLNLTGEYLGQTK